MVNFSLNLFENGIDFIPDAVNQDANSDVSGDWINMEGVERAYLVLIKPAGTAGDDLSIAMNQASDSSGTGSKALTNGFTRLWHKIGAPASTGQWTSVTLSTASSDLDLVSVNSVDLATDTSVSVIVTELIPAQHMDTNGGFKFVQAFYEGDDIGNALIINSHWILMRKEGKNVHESALA